MPDALELSRLLSNENAKVTIVFIKSGGINLENNISSSIEGFITKEFSFPVSATWESPFDMLAPAQKAIQNLGNLIGGVANQILGAGGISGMEMITAKAFSTTVKDYMGGNNLAFIIDLMFIALSEDDDPRQKVISILEGVLPGESKLTFGLTMAPPLGFSRGLYGAESGYVALSIGRWFKADQLVITSVTPSFSKEVTKTGVPLYAAATVQFETIAAPSYNVVKEWFNRKNI